MAFQRSKSSVRELQPVAPAWRTDHNGSSGSCSKSPTSAIKRPADCPLIRVKGIRVKRPRDTGRGD